MNSDLFEQEFGLYLENSLHDRAEDAMFRLLREAYRAGWEAACRHSKLLCGFLPEDT